jgi:hypothetical protein
MDKSLIAHKSRWSSRIYPSSTEAEVVALHNAAKLGIWLRKLISTFGYSPTVIFADNQGCIKYYHSKDRAGRLAHIDIKYHWTREKILSKELELQYIHSTKNLSDIMTKTLGGRALSLNRHGLGLTSPEHVS